MKGDVSFYETLRQGDLHGRRLRLGINEYYTPSFLNSGAWGDYASVTAKYTAPEHMALGPLGWYVSGEFGRQWLGTSDAFYGTPAFPGGIDYKDYNTWNIGLGLTWKVFTLDLRYSDTDLSKSDCNAFTGDHTASFDPVGDQPDQSERPVVEVVRRYLHRQAVGRPDRREPQVSALVSLTGGGA